MIRYDSLITNCSVTVYNINTKEIKKIFFFFIFPCSEIILLFAKQTKHLTYYITKNEYL
jgi:hypothetical protein